MNLEATHTDTDNGSSENEGRRIKPSIVARRDATRHFRTEIEEKEREEAAGILKQDDPCEKSEKDLGVLRQKRQAEQPKILPIPKSEEGIKAVFEASEAIRDELDKLDLIRPKTRGECSSVPRPCPFVGCKYSNYLDVNPVNGRITFNHPGLTPDQIPPAYSCALDVADMHQDNRELPANIVGNIIGLSKTRIAQMEDESLPSFALLGRR